MDREQRAAEVEDATDELLALLLDELGPIVQWYRDEVARRLRLSPTELLCLDVCRRWGPISSGRIGERLGLTRSAVAKLLRRLETEGHVVREIGRDHEQAIEVRLRPHARRDQVLEDLREDLRRSVREVVADQELRAARHALAAGVLAGLGQAVFRHARVLADAAIERRLRTERRARREAEESPIPWWAR
ncbi:hypothetical protein GCM10023200_09750 [Actinomycetospora chlora]|uniref:HTH marR-type domain-containing protein n=1 Tax=Actinomycetospora chlora TaxID=663608 RepID=A0ABP9AC59_9PSEU